MFPFSALDDDYIRSPTPAPPNSSPFFVYAGPAFSHPQYKQWRLDDDEHFNVNSLSRIFSSAMASLDAAPSELSLPSFDDVKALKIPCKLPPFQYIYDSLTYQGVVDCGPYWCTNRTNWVVNVRLSNDGFLYPHPDELKGQPFKRSHHKGRSGWYTVSEKGGYFSAITKYVANWMKLPFQSVIMYNPYCQRLDMYFRAIDKVDLTLARCADGELTSSCSQPYSFNISFEPGAPVTSFDDDLWESCQ
jgi:hypothetical protein